MSVTLNKASDKSPYGGNPGTTYKKTPDGRVSELELMFRRYDNGGRVSREWAYYLRNNDLRELQGFYRHS
ncbi:hypothetical protein SEA_IBANTIK_99 [Streptomyces phage Ibantik]|uniref:Uncharacterized protein n=1 Tax=Streptomyces phage Ibantik TaxID=2182397 RepID=A0A2U8UPB9_9CAUD|nr:hypothetical protein QEH36_gp066 [Streptomyces phage Ibantik]AWN05321.1 hypothetical protein SEA_IBANTIK_99 [Streptomyces phage Ibantik]